MKKTLALLAITNLLSLNAYGEDIGRITVEIRNVKDKPKSTLICAVFDSKRGFPKDSQKAIQLQDAKIEKDTAHCEFDLPVNKEYAISVAHDENGNRKLDMNIFGVPTEGWATSNNVTHTFKAPEFEESKVIIKSKSLKVSLMMHY